MRARKEGAPMKRILTPLAFAAAMLLLIARPSLAQPMPAPPLGAVQPSAPGAAGQPPVVAPSLPLQKSIDGPVKKVDPIAKTVRVGWFFGLFSTTLQVTENTDIAVEGAKASLQDIREGDEVKASYETRDGKDVAKLIDATHPAAPGGAGPMKSGPGSSPSSQVLAPKGSPAPPAGGAKTP